MIMEYYKSLIETGIEINRGDFLCLSEAAQIKVSDDVLTKMFKFITDKYNSIDFSEIEKSGGDILKFKYHDMILQNAQTLSDIYSSSDDIGAQKYLEVIKAVFIIMRHLEDNRQQYSTLYKMNNGVIQLIYTSLVSSCLYSIGVLVSNTIRFVTTEKDTECQVLYDEIPGTMKHVHIKNILSATSEGNMKAFETILDEYMKNTRTGSLKESVAISATVGTGIVIGALILLIPRIILLIREIIYSIYYERVKVSEMLDLQVQLIRTNIESLEAGRGNKKVIARQKSIANLLERWKTKISVKIDTANVLVNKQISQENASLKLDKNSPFLQNADSGFNKSDLML